MLSTPQPTCFLIADIELAIIEQGGPVFTEILRASQRNLVAGLDAALEAGIATEVSEPDLPTARPDGVLAGITPLAIVE